MSDSADELGYVVVDIRASVIRMLAMQMNGFEDYHDMTPEVRICADSMMRAAASYGANNGAYKIESHILPLNDFYTSIGFKMEHDIVSCDLTNIIKVCKK
jgi:hypothetical protein